MTVESLPWAEVWQSGAEYSHATAAESSAFLRGQQENGLHEEQKEEEQCEADPSSGS